jgi:hypothetical protein
VGTMVGLQGHGNFPTGIQSPNGSVCRLLLIVDRMLAHRMLKYELIKNIISIYSLILNTGTLPNSV